jgi:NADH dehydrogenase FAD-containing subunit
MEITEKSRKRLEAKLLNLGVTLMLRTTIEIPKDNEENEEIYYKGKAGWKTLAGDVVHADLVLDCRGILNPRTEFIQSFDSNILDTKRFIKVRKTFQVEGYDHIFAIGDVAASGNSINYLGAAKMTFLLDGQVSIVAKNINASLSKKALCNYKIPPYNTAIISVGQKDAWAAFGSFSNSISDFLGHKLKSKDLFLSMAKKTYGAK